MSKIKRPPLIEEEWILICRMRYEKRKIQEIAHILRRPSITIERALKRFPIPPYLRYSDWEKYGRYCYQQAKANRGKYRAKRRKLKNPFILNYVKEGLEKRYSPEQISLRLKIDHPEHSISYEAIYDWVYCDPDGSGYKQYLPRGPRERKQGKPGCRGLKGRKPKSPDKVSIESRPESANTRECDGALEGDLIIGSGGKSCLLVMINRKTRRVWIRKIKSKESMVVYWAMLGVLRTLPEEERRTFTTDNGTEFAKWKDIENLIGIWFYFCHAYCSFEKGTIENRNGVIRNRFFKKGTNFDNISHDEIKIAETWMNNCPIKLHGGYTALEMEAKFRKERLRKKEILLDDYKIAA